MPLANIYSSLINTPREETLTMAVTALITIAPSPSVDTTIRELQTILESSTTRFIIGTHVQDPTTIQITSEWPSHFANSHLPRLNAYSPTITLANLSQSPFPNTPPPVVEYVKIDFPATSCTPAFQAGIEADFARFEEILRKRGSMQACGEVFLTTGWTVGAEGKEGEGEGEIKSFVVVRGWEGMQRFEEAVSTEEFREAVPILMGWGAPYKLVCVI
jgi:hypothetical protein